MKPIWDLLSGDAGAAASGQALTQLLIWAVGTVVFITALYVFIRTFASRARSETRIALHADLSEAASGAQPSVTRAKNQVVTRSTVIKLDKAAFETARELKETGRDFDSICRAIEPDYARWGSVQQRVFRDALEAILKTIDEKANA
jgi:hypothetical protein